MSGIVGGINLRSSGLVNNSSATDGQVFTGTGAGLPAGFEAAAGGGKILQVVKGTVRVAVFSTTSTSFTDITGMTATITPSATSSQILVLCFAQFAISSDDQGCAVQLTRTIASTETIISGGTQEGSNRCSAISHIANVDNAIIFPFITNYIDEPSTTSACVYQGRMLVESATGYAGRSGDDADTTHFSRSAIFINLIEIDGS